ncbi:ankyrin repeat-containing protein [Xylaria grammica]|nr:ankyrin repeat-containing protein [Xylaria grammica]
MRLLNTTTLTVSEFKHDQIPPYAILSHTWGENEATLQDMKGTRAARKKGHVKVLNFCSLAKANGFEYVWIDTCCIDKTSSTELSEAINSMFRWYEQADICYAYLSDVPPGTDAVDKFRTCKWFTRGWTLQELLAPSSVIFLNRKWETMGDKSDLQHAISRITGIPLNFLLGDDLGYASVAQRMSWAAKRQTTRIEDVAYCLMGIFGIYMPMLYGEGERAFIRLQEEILRVTNDHSLFAWRSLEDNGGILAASPAAFDSSGGIIQTTSFGTMSSPPTVTSRGIYLSLQFGESGPQGSGLAILDCTETGKENKRFAIYLNDIFLTKHDFTRTKSSMLELLDLENITLSQYPRTDMYIRQGRPKRDKKGATQKCAIKIRGVETDDLVFRAIHLHPTWELHDELMITTTSLPINGTLGRLLVIRSDRNPFQLVLRKRGRLITVEIHNNFETDTRMVRAPIVSKQLRNERDQIVGVLDGGQHVHVSIERRILMLGNGIYLTGIVEIDVPNTPGVWLRNAAILEGDIAEPTLFSYAIKRQYDIILKLLLDAKTHKVDWENENVNAALLLASRNGNEAVAKVVLDTDRCDIDFKDEMGATALSLAASNGHRAIVELLLENWANPESHDFSHRTPLICAELNGHSTVLELLVKRKAELDLIYKTFCPRGLAYGASDGQGVVNWLLEIHPAKYQLALKAAKGGGHEGLVKLLLKRIPDIKSESSFVDGTLIWAAENGHTSILLALLEKGAYIEPRGPYSRTPLFFAAKNGHTATVQILLERGANMRSRDEFDDTPLTLAAQNGHTAIVQILLEEGANIESRGFYDKTPLICAAGNGHESLVKFLLACGAKCESQDKAHKTALHLAMMNKHESVVRLLKEERANLNSQSPPG